jgi:uncharacterized protein YcgL (UPF0745 family)
VSRYNLYWVSNLSRYRNLVEAAWCSVAVQTWSDLIICHGIKSVKRADAGIRVQEQDDFNSVQDLFAKTVTKKCFLLSVL